MPQPQVLEHPRGGAVGLGGQGQERAGGGVGENTVPGLALPGELSGHDGGDGDGAIQGAGFLGCAEQGQGRDGDGETEPLPRDLHAVGVQARAGEQFVAQPGQGQGLAVGGDRAVGIQGRGLPGLQGVALGVLDGAGGGVQALGQGEDLGDRADHLEAADAVLPHRQQVDAASSFGGVLGRGLSLCVDAGQGVGEAAPVLLHRQLPQRPGGDALVEGGQVRGCQVAGAAQQALEPLAGELPGCEPCETARESGEGAVGVVDAVVGSGAGAAQGQSDCEGLGLVLIGPGRVTALRELQLPPEPGQTPVLDRQALGLGDASGEQFLQARIDQQVPQDRVIQISTRWCHRGAR